MILVCSDVVESCDKKAIVIINSVKKAGKDAQQDNKRTI